jgi:hypothetical protein
MEVVRAASWLVMMLKWVHWVLVMPLRLRGLVLVKL